MKIKIHSMYSYNKSKYDKTHQGIRLMLSLLIQS